jgi:predicted nucleotidyltransferase
VVLKKFIWFYLKPHGNQKVYIVTLVTMIKMIKKLKKSKVIELNEAYQKTLHWFFCFPEREIGLNDLSEALKISKTTAKRIVLQLMEEGFLKREIIGKLWRISCNQNHQYNTIRKVPYNLALIYNTYILEKIHEKIRNPKAVILFGSYRKGDDNEKSDIDIAVEVVGNEDVKIIELGVVGELGYRKNVPINLYVFSRNKVDINLFSNIANGIVLEGLLEVRP